MRAGLASLLATGCVLQASAQFTLPGRIRIQLPRNGNSPYPARRGPERSNPDKVCPNLVNWVKPVFEEYPGQDLMHVEMNRLQTMEIPLFADANFVPFFHKSYTQMRPDELDTIFRTQFVVCDQSTYRTQIPGVEYAFNTRGGNSPISSTRLPAALAELSDARAAIARQVAAMDSLPLSAEGYDALHSDEIVGNAALPQVWPSERKAFQDALLTAQTRLAPAALSTRVDALLAAPPTLDGLRALHDAPSNDSALFSKVPPAAAQTMRARLDTRSAQVATTLLAQERRTMLSFNSSRTGLQQGAAWLQSFQSNYVTALDVPGATQLAAQYKQTRQRQLLTHDAELRRSIETARNEADLQPLLDGVYAAPSDRDTPSYASLQKQVDLRTAVFEKNKTLAAAAEEKAGAARRARLVATARASHGLPSARAFDAQLEASSLNTQGLTSQDSISKLYQGDFAHVELSRNGTQFGMLFSEYLTVFAQQCADYLPEDKVQMTALHCAVYQHMVNGYGTQVGPDTCARFDRVPLPGQFADPKAFEAVVDLEGNAPGNLLRNVVSALKSDESGGSVIGSIGTMAGQAVDSQKDMTRLLQINDCASPALTRLQTNMTRFAEGDQPIHLSSYQPDTSGPLQTAEALDVDTLAADLIEASAQDWVLNHYQGLRFASLNPQRDSLGRPIKISASYEQSGIGAGGSVDITFVDGVPACLYFSDDPSDCKQPSRSVVQAYQAGHYKKHPHN